MVSELINYDYPQDNSNIIKVIGVGGGGGNAVDYMYEQGIVDVDFMVCNTDEQVLKKCVAPMKIQLGKQLTMGLGAGNDPEIGRQAAIESINQLSELLSHHTEMVFITAGMGGGTGTGAAPIIAEETKSMGILTVAIVTMPFGFEGALRMQQARDGIRELKEHVDSILIIDNEKLFDIFCDEPISKAFNLADNVLNQAAKGIAEIVTVCGKINVDFADVKTVMKDSGLALMGSGMASGENREIEAVKDALHSPLLDIQTIKETQKILLNITSSKEHEVTMKEFKNITQLIKETVGAGANIIWGNTLEDSMGDALKIVIVCTGFGENSDEIIRFYLEDFMEE